MEGGPASLVSDPGKPPSPSPKTNWQEKVAAVWPLVAWSGISYVTKTTTTRIDFRVGHFRQWFRCIEGA